MVACDLGYFSKDTAGGDHPVALLQVFNQFLMFLHPLGLRTDHKEIKNNPDQGDHQQVLPPHSAGAFGLQQNNVCEKRIHILFVLKFQFALALTSPASVSCTTAGSVLAWTVIDLLCFPTRPLLSNTALISPVPPGGMGSLVHSGTVQPQEAIALEIIRLLDPTFLKR